MRPPNIRPKPGDYKGQAPTPIYNILGERRKTKEEEEIEINGA